MLEVTEEHDGNEDAAEVTLVEFVGHIHADLTVGANVAAAVPLLATGLGGCPADTPVEPPDASAPDVIVAPESGTWRDVATSQASAFLAVSGASRSDVYVVGADKGAGPAVYHFDGAAWTTFLAPASRCF